LGNKNLDHELKDKLDNIRNNTNMMSVVNSNLSIIEANQAQQANQELAIRGAVNQVYALSAINNIYRQGNGTNSIKNHYCLGCPFFKTSALATSLVFINKG
jgi:hypothetical protein